MRITLTAAAAVLCLATPASAATIPVTTTGDVVAQDGKCSLREAIANANSPGSPSGGCKAADAVGNTIALKKGKTYRLTIQGARAGNATGDLDVAGSVNGLTIGGQATIDATGLGDRVLSIASGATATLRQVRLTGGQPPAELGAQNEPKPGENGGGILNQGGLKLVRGTVSRNTAGTGVGSGNGGGGGHGGGIYTEAPGTLELIASTISNNRAGYGGDGENNGGNGGSGGGIFATNGVTITGSTISGNNAGDGGASVAGGPSYHGGIGGSGGGLYVAGGFLTNVTVRGNFAGKGGDGDGSSNPNGNGGPGGTGGGIVRAGAVAGMTLLNVTVTQNGFRAGGAAGTGPPGGTPGAAGTIGGIYGAGTAGDQSACGGTCLTPQNTIVALNAPPNCGGYVGDFGGNLTFGDTSCAYTNAAPKLGPLQDNGGATRTVAIAATSAARKLAASGCPKTDQRGAARPNNNCDAGAFQFTKPAVKISSPVAGKRYRNGARLFADFRCTEDGVPSALAKCVGTKRDGARINTTKPGLRTFKVTAVDKAGNRASKTIQYRVKQPE